MPRIAFIGAGSTVFTRNLIGDVLSLPELAGSTFALMDIDAARLRTSEAVVRRLVEAHGVEAAVEATLDRRAALAGADYVFTSFEVGGPRPSTVIDFEVPKRYGLRQTIADTLGIGGIMRGQRTIPVLLGVCRDMEELCPDALLLQYVNPMAPLCWAVAEASSVRAVGLCHSVQHTAAELAHDLGVPAGEVEHLAAGINHLAFFLQLERGGEDLYPALRDVTPPDHNRVRYEPLDEHVRRSEAQIAEWDGEPAISLARSDEYGADIIRACETGEPFAFNGNVRNGALIENLPPDCCVEVPCVASARGIEPQPVGSLPRRLAALMQTHVGVQGLIVEAALTGSRDAVYHAAMLDPHTAAELSLDEIRRLVDDLLEAHGDSIPRLAA